MDNLGKALFWKYPGNRFQISDEGYETLLWDATNEMKQPSKEEALAALEEYKAYYATIAYKNKRKAEYPTLDELTIAMWESINEGKSESMEALQALRLEVKKKYPKP